MDATRTDRPGHEVVELSSLTDSQATEVLALANIANDADGAHPLSEYVRLNLLTKERGFNHLTIRDTDGSLAGYAHLSPASDGVSAAAVVHPAKRRRGLGRRLIAASTDLALRAASRPDTESATPDAANRLRIWAHGDHPSAAALAVDLGFARARVLWQLRRSLAEPLPEPRSARRGGRCAPSGRAPTTRPGSRSTAAPSPSIPSRAGGTLKDLARAVGRAVVRPGRLPARGGGDQRPAARLPLDQGARREPGRRRSADRRGVRARRRPGPPRRGLGRALALAGLALPAGPRGWTG